MKPPSQLIMSCCELVTILALSACSQSASRVPTENITADPSGWEPRLPIAQSQDMSFRSAYSMAATPNGDMWATVEPTCSGPNPDNWSNEIDRCTWLIRYVPQAGKIVKYTNAFEDGWGFPLSLFVSRDGTLWMLLTLNPLPKRAKQPAGTVPVGWVLSRYDPSADHFVLVKDSNQSLRSNWAAKMGQDHDGVLWFLAGSDRLDATVVRYDPIANEAKRVLLQQQSSTLSGKTIRDLAVASSGTLWLLTGDAEVLEYNPATGAIKDYGIPPGQKGSYHNLYIGHSGRLWLTSIAWMDFPSGLAPMWHSVVHPDPFSSDVMHQANRGEWVEPYAIYESSDGMVWFSSEVGIVMYDPANDKWQKMAAFPSAVAEDKMGYLWTAANGQFYRFKRK